MTEAQEQETLEFVKQRNPDYYERLVELREDNPRRYRRAIGSWYLFLQRWKHMSPELRDATIREREAQVRILKTVRQIHATEDPAEKERLREQLNEDVTEHFEAEQKLREQRLAQLIEQINRIRSEMKERSEQREKIVAERVVKWLERRERPERKGPRRGRWRRRPAPETQPTAP